MTGTSSSCSSSGGSQSRALSRVASELDALRSVPLHDGADFPPACRTMMYSLPGNCFCVDCGNPQPEWASVTYGVLLCVQCSGRHRSYGVQTSFVRSITMDAWSHSQVLAMLEGGNQQLQSFFQRHRMGNHCDPTGTMTSTRYRTKAALFYSTHLKMHAEVVAESGSYTGREATRQQQNQQGVPQRKLHSVANQPLEPNPQQPIAVGNQ